MSAAQLVAFGLIIPFVGVFAYAGWQEYRRFKTEGSSAYGLTYDPETNTTHVGALPENEESFDPDEFEPEITDALAAEQTDDKEQETRT